MIATRRPAPMMLLIAALFSLMSASAALAQPPPPSEDPRPTFTATFGLGRYLTPERWNPVRVEITGGAEPADGVIRLSVADGLDTPMTLTAPFAATPGKTAFVDLAVPIPAGNSGFGDDPLWIDIELLNGRGRIIRAASFTLDGRRNTVQIIANEAGRNARVFLGVGTSSLRQAPNSWQMNNPSNAGWNGLAMAWAVPESLPTVWMAYDAFDSVMLTPETTARLDASQRDALTDWVGAGGCVVLIASPASPDFSWLLGEPPVRMASGTAGQRPRFELTPNGRARAWTVRDLRMPALEDEAGQNPAALSTRGLGAIAEGLVGNGWVTLVMDDPIDVYPWGDEGDLWRDVLSRSMQDRLPMVRDDDRYFTYLSERARTMDAVMNIAAEEMGLSGNFPIVALGAALVALALLVGVVDRFLLRRLRLTRFAWLSALGWIALVSGAGYLGPRFVRASSNKQHRLIATDINTLDGHASRSGLVSFFSGQTAARELKGTAPGSWWSRSATAHQPWADAASTSLTLYANQFRGSTPTLLPMGVWTLNYLTDEQRFDSPVTGRVVAWAGRRQRLELTGLPTDAVDVIVRSDGASCRATRAGDGLWDIAPPDFALQSSYNPPDLAEFGNYSLRFVRSGGPVDAALSLAGAARRAPAVDRALESRDLAVVYATVRDEASDVAVTLRGEQEADRLPRIEVFRIIVPVVHEEVRP